MYSLSQKIKNEAIRLAKVTALKTFVELGGHVSRKDLEYLKEDPEALEFSALLIISSDMQKTAQENNAFIRERWGNIGVVWPVIEELYNNRFNSTEFDEWKKFLQPRPLPKGIDKVNITPDAVQQMEKYQESGYKNLDSTWIEGNGVRWTYWDCEEAFTECIVNAAKNVVNDYFSEALVGWKQSSFFQR